jgi:hypothetical protein
MAIERFLKGPQMRDVENILAGYFKALDFIMAEIFNLEMPFIDDPLEVK